MESRKIKIMSSLTGVSFEVESAATNFGGLKTDVLEQYGEIQWGSVNAIVVDTETGLASNNSVLPEGPFRIALVVAKTDNGNGAYIDSAGRYRNASNSFISKAEYEASNKGSKAVSEEARSNFKEDMDNTLDEIRGLIVAFIERNGIDPSSKMIQKVSVNVQSELRALRASIKSSNREL